MKDADIRPVLDARLRRVHGDSPDTEIIHEFGIYCGIHRVDMAVVNGVLSGYEIKSEKDTLKRLPAQAQAYSMLFDKMTLVVSERHYEGALAIVPAWWGIFRAEPGKTKVKLKEVRRGSINKGVKPHALAALIWRDQALGILEERGAAKGLRSASRDKLWDALVECLTLEELQAETRTAVRRQRQWLQENRPPTDAG